MSVPQTLTASRNATWPPPLAYPYAGPALPLTNAHIAMQIRQYPGAVGDALLTIGSFDYTDQLLSGTAGMSDEVRVLTLFHADVSLQLATIPSGVEAGSDLRLSFDIRITYADGQSDLLVTPGVFILTPGVTVV
jgi:hypothetical protein